MSKFKFKNNENTTIQDAEEALEELRNINVPEIPFNHIKKIAEYLGCEYYPSKGTGSSEHFRHECLVGYRMYYDGFFQIHSIKGKVVNRANFRKYFYLPLMAIIKIKKKQKNKDEKEY